MATATGLAITTASAAAIATAVADAGVRVNELPLTPERVWRAIDGQAKEVEETHG